MANEKTEGTTKVSALVEFKKSLMNKEGLVAAVTEGLKSKNSKVRSLAIKTAFKMKDHAFIKKNILPLIAAEKSKKVLRTISAKITRRDLVKKVRGMTAAKKPHGAAKDEGSEAPAAAAQG